MVPRLLPVVLALLILSSLAWAQAPAGPTDLTVRVSLMDDRPAPSQLRVQLLTSSELSVTESFTDETGMAHVSARPGNYRIRVSGPQIEETVTSVFTISPRELTRTEFVRVRKLPSNDDPAEASSGLVALSQMNIPAKALKEYEKAGKALQAGNWAEARVRLEGAISMFPQFAAAWNDLGVVHMNMGDREAARTAFQKSLEFHPNYARACRNLALLLFSEGGTDEATTLVEKALASDPLDPQALTLMAQLQLLAGKTDEALANARKVHSAPHQGQAVVHYIAARVLEMRNQHEQAAAEYRLFLQEAPNSASADKARAALDKLAAKAN